MTTEAPIRLSVSETAKLFGLSSKTVRQAIKNGHISYVVIRGRYKVNFASALEWSQASTRRHNRLQTGGIGRYVDNWRITNRKYSPRPPS